MDNDIEGVTFLQTSKQRTKQWEKLQQTKIEHIYEKESVTLVKKLKQK